MQKFAPDAKFACPTAVVLLHMSVLSTKPLNLVAVLQAAPHQPLVTLLRSQGLSLLMRQFIMYAVAMADSDQESLIIDQPAPPPSQLQPTQASSQLQLPVVAQHASSAAPSGSATASITSSASSAAATAGLQPSMSSSAASPASVASQPAPAAAAAEHQPAAEEPAAAASASTSGMMTVEQGVQALRQYLSSVGRHGPSSGAFLTPMYGCAELPQAFCRCTLTGRLAGCISSACMYCIKPCDDCSMCTVVLDYCIQCMCLACHVIKVALMPA